MLKWDDVDIVQDACNAWDQRMLNGSMIDHMQRVGKLCLMRSVYLQGLLLLSPEETREKIPVAYEASKKWNEIAKELDMTIKQLAFSFGLFSDVPFLVGVESVEQVVDNIKMYEQTNNNANIISIVTEKMEPFLTPDIWCAIEMYGRKNYVWKGREKESH